MKPTIYIATVSLLLGMAIQYVLDYPKTVIINQQKAEIARLVKDRDSTLRTYHTCYKEEWCRNIMEHGK